MNPSKRLRTRIIILLSIIVILVVGVVIIAALPSGAKNLDLSARLSELVGVIQVQNGAQNQFNPVNNGFLLNSIMQLQTMAESRVRLDLSTGSIVRLGQSTIFSLGQQQAVTGGVLSKIELQAGRVWVILKGGSLDVNTPGGLASVRGSYMSVWYEPNSNRITVCCLEGSCGYQDAAGDVDLTSGQKIVSSDTNSVPPIEKMDQTDVQSWLDNSPEAAAIVPQISGLLASSTPLLTPTSTNETATITPTATPTPDLSLTAGLGTPTPTSSSTLTPTRTLSTDTMTPTLLTSPSSTPTLTATVQPNSNPTATQIPSPTEISTSTLPPPTETLTSTLPPPTATPTRTRRPPTRTPTSTLPPPTGTPTSTLPPPTATPTRTRRPPTATPTPTLYG